jgi:hypothetical protein
LNAPAENALHQEYKQRPLFLGAEIEQEQPFEQHYSAFLVTV